MKHIAKILIFALVVSLLCVGGASAANDFEGTWEYDDYYLWYEFDTDGTWWEYNRDGLVMDGYYEVSGDILRAYLPEGTRLHTMEMDGRYLVDEYGDTLFSSNLSIYNSSELVKEGFTGVWEYSAGGGPHVWLQIYAGGTFVEYYEKYGFWRMGGVRLLSDNTIELYDDDDSSLGVYTLNASGSKLTSDYDEEYVRSTLPYSNGSYVGSGQGGDWVTQDIIDNMDGYFRKTLRDTFNGSDWSHDYLDNMELLGYYELVSKTNGESDNYIYLLYRVTAHNTAAGASMDYYWFGCYEDVSSDDVVSMSRRTCFTNNAGDEYKLYIGNDCYYYGYSTQADFEADQITPRTSSYAWNWIEL